MAPIHGPDTASGHPEQSDVDEPLRDDTASLTGSASSMTMGVATGSGLDTIAAAGMSELPALAPGEQIGEFKIERQLGSGGMGQVFAARRLGFGPGSSPGADASSELVALKYLERTSASMLYRFKQEFRALADVTHENLVTLGELVVAPEMGTFFTMELVDGVPFDTYVRGRTPSGELPNLARLRRAFRQLVAGVRHLHQHNCIHRDLKPTNVLVTAEGRVVVLDFGLIQDRSGEVADEPTEQIMGTPAYMSPEQAGLERAGPAADWYAVGVMLFECLTGKRPFRGTLTHLLFAKREFEPPDVFELVPDVPDELAELCQRLLARHPEDRPSGREIAAVLGARGEGPSLLHDAETSMVGTRAPFIGRYRELAVLAAAFRGVRDAGRQVTVHVRGRSGYGKSALVREFLAGVRERGDAVVLKGRCLERESVPYKGLDPIIDALSIHLRSLPSETLAELEPAHPAALVRLFPVLDDLWPQGAGVGPRGVGGLDVHELRQRAFAALRELLTKLARRRPLILYVDDFHWGNVDSARLLTELVRPTRGEGREAPESGRRGDIPRSAGDPPAMLVVVTFRDEVETNESLQALTAAEALADRDVREIFVGPLSREDARELALALMGDERDVAQADAYAAGAEGSPFYVGQMVHGVSTEGLSPGQLDQIVVRRILALDAESRRLLEVVAVAGGPTDSEAVFGAAELDDPERLVKALREAELIKVRMSGGVGLGVTLETAHDRIREVTVGELDPADLRATHLRLAVALERHGSEPRALAEHFERGGERATAADHYESAAAQAASSLAFGEAVVLLRKTLEQLSDDADPLRIAKLRRRLAEQLVNVGRGHEAAKLMLELAEWYEQPERADKAATARARELRRLAADQLIKTGHVDAGLAELDKLLRTVGLRLPPGKAAAVSALLWEQARLRMRGFEFQRREAGELPVELLDRIDTCFAVVNGLSTQETLLSALFHFRNLRLSLAAGEPSRVARALAYQCVIDVAGSDWRRVEQHFATARALAAEADDPQLSGFIDLCEASVHWFERRYRQSSPRHTEVIESLEGVAGAAWDRRTAQLHHMWTLVCQGRLTEFWARARGANERARERRDMQEMIEVSSYSAVALVLAGKLDEARRVLGAAQAEWNPGRYLFGDVWACFGQAAILLHEDQPEQAVTLVENTLAQMKRTFLDQSATARHNAQEYLCRAYLAAALHGDPRSAKRARKLGAKLRAAKLEVLTGMVAMIDAGLASMTGDREAALACWSEAAAAFEAQGVEGHLAAIAARKAEVLGRSPEAVALRRSAQDYFTREGIEDVEGFCRVLAPADMSKLVVPG
jgi:eukaryotic-like serine/threonine-protein kinase